MPSTSQHLQHLYASDTTNFLMSPTSRCLWCLNATPLPLTTPPTLPSRNPVSTRCVKWRQAQCVFGLVLYRVSIRPTSLETTTSTAYMVHWAARRRDDIFFLGKLEAGTTDSTGTTILTDAFPDWRMQHLHNMDWTQTFSWWFRPQQRTNSTRQPPPTRRSRYTPKVTGRPPLSDSGHDDETSVRGEASEDPRTPCAIPRRMTPPSLPPAISIATLDADERRFHCHQLMPPLRRWGARQQGKLENSYQNGASVMTTPNIIWIDQTTPDEVITSIAIGIRRRRVSTNAVPHTKIRIVTSDVTDIRSK